MTPLLIGACRRAAATVYVPGRDAASAPDTYTDMPSDPREHPPLRALALRSMLVAIGVRHR